MHIRLHNFFFIYASLNDYDVGGHFLCMNFILWSFMSRLEACKHPFLCPAATHQRNVSEIENGLFAPELAIEDVIKGGRLY